MRRLLSSTLRPAAVAVALGAVVAGPASAEYAPVEAVKLEPVKGSSVSGRATYQGKGNTTVVTVRVDGLRPGATFRANLNAGTCERPSASTTQILTGKADAKGTARASAVVRFRGKPLPISTVADGDHLVAIVANGKTVACAVLPGMS